MKTISDRELVSRIHEELSKFNKKTSNKNTSLKKWVKYLNRHFTNKDIQMANELINRCSKSLVIWEMHIKTTVRYHYKHVRTAFIEKHWQYQMLTEIWSKGNSHTVLVELQNGTAALENGLTISHKAKRTFTLWFSDPTPQNLP